MVTLCAQRTGDRETAVRGIRAVCQYFGGQQIFIPKFKTSGSSIGGQLRGILSDAVGDSDAEKMLDVLMTMFGGVQIYIPMEYRAFRSEIAAEIKEKYDGNMETLRDLCREYRMSFTQVYRLWHKAQEEKLQNQFDFNNG